MSSWVSSAASFFGNTFLPTRAKRWLSREAETLLTETQAADLRKMIARIEELVNAAVPLEWVGFSEYESLGRFCFGHCVKLEVKLFDDFFARILCLMI